MVEDRRTDIGSIWLCTNVFNQQSHQCPCVHLFNQFTDSMSCPQVTCMELPAITISLKTQFSIWGLRSYFHEILCYVPFFLGNC